MSKGTILYDIDGVVADLHTEWVRRYNEDWDDALRVEDICDWGMSQFVKPECGAAIYDYLHRADLYERVEPIEGALEGVAQLRKVTGCDVAFVTSCVGTEMIGAKLAWMRRHGFLALGSYVGLVPEHGRPSGNKGLLRGALLIDDYHKNIVEFGGPGVLVSHPHNRSVHGFVRASSWEDIPWIADSVLSGEVEDAA